MAVESAIPPNQPATAPRTDPTSTATATARLAPSSEARDPYTVRA